MTFWEFLACIDGYTEAHGAKKKRGDLNEDQLMEMGIVGFSENNI